METDDQKRQDEQLLLPLGRAMLWPKRPAEMYIPATPTILLFLTLLLSSIPAFGQAAYRFDKVVQGPTGQAIATASVAVCTQPAVTTTQPCSPLATLYPDSTATNYSISSISCSAFVVTVTTSTTNFIPVGQWVKIAGVTNASFNGTFQVTSQAAGTFTYSQPCTNGSSSGGTLPASPPVSPLLRYDLAR